MRTTLKPNLFIIGSMKSGTTYLWSLLSSHPSIFMSRFKEPSYFVDASQLQKHDNRIWTPSEEDYLRMFQSAGTATILGEASVYYAHLPIFTGVPERIRKFNPEARLIYVMRDPIERTISHYWQRVENGREYRPLSDAIKNDPSYRNVSHYAMQLLPYFERFSRDQIKLLTFEEMISNTREVFKSICRWLKLDASVPIPIPQPSNVTPEIVVQPILSGLLHRLRHENHFFRLAVDRVPNSVRKIGGRILRRQKSRLDVDPSEVVQYLRPLQRRQTQELTQLIAREFPEWTTLNRREF
jgi:Sulfotransferase family